MPQKEKFLRSGFTLMEVLITVSIIAVIVGIVSFMNIKSTLEKGRDAKRKTDLNKLVRVMEDYYNDNGRYPPVDSTLDGKIKDAPWGSAFSSYVPALPKDPSSSQEYYYFSDPDDGNFYSIFSKLENTTDTNISAVGCENGCGPNLAYNYVVHSSNVIMSNGLPNGEPIPIGQEEEPSATPTPSPSATLVIGESYQGGKVAYLDGTGYHGLIAASSDQSTGSRWGCIGTTITGADGTAIGTGNQNTIDIMAGCAEAGSGCAARVCGDLDLNGYTDWYLPSKDELNQLYLNKTAIGGFADNFYWSSSEFAITIAWRQNLTDGAKSNTSKIFSQYVRCIRTF